MDGGPVSAHNCQHVQLSGRGSGTTRIWQWSVRSVPEAGKLISCIPRRHRTHRAKLFSEVFTSG